MTGPSTFAARSARSAPSAEPLTKMIRRLDRSRCLIWSSPRSTRRRSITGTTTIALALCRSRLSSVSSGSKRRRTTSVEPSATPTSACMNPSAWNIGTHSSVVSSARNGTLLNRPPSKDSDLGSLRGAPLGVPVVPLVRIVTRGGSPGFGGASVDAPAISASIESSGASSSSVHARKRPCGGSSIPSSTFEYSSS